MNNGEAIKIINQYDMNFHWNDGEPILAEQLAEAFDLAISALEKQEADSNKCCETCKYKNLAVSESPCDECYFASDFEDYYEPCTEEES